MGGTAPPIPPPVAATMLLVIIAPPALPSPALRRLKLGAPVTTMPGGEARTIACGGSVVCI